MEKNTVILGLEEYNDLLDRAERYDNAKNTKAFREVKKELVQKYIDEIHSSYIWKEIKFKEFSDKID